MKRLTALACLATAVSLLPGTAMADSIKGQFGVTGRIGFLVPADNDAEFGINRTNRTDTGFIGGGGLLYGIDDRLAADFEVTRAYFGSDTGDFQVSDVSLGGQYRFKLPQDPRFVPYAGGGLDILVTDYDANDGAGRHVDTTVGIHAKGGIDYFIEKQVALTAEAKIILAPDADIPAGGRRSGDFDPSSFSSTVGVRYFFK